MESQPMIRQPAVAGQFYPNESHDLIQMVQQYIEESKATESLSFPKALIVPHAGYIYSGAIAGAAYAQLLPFKEQINKVILIGPSHHVGFSGAALPEESHFNTPLGLIPIDREVVSQLAQLPFVIQSSEAHQWEHSLEVQLPFLQHLLDQWTLVPIVIGQATPGQIESILEMTQNWDHTIVVISTDLSHFHTYEKAKSIDENTNKLIINKDYLPLDGQMACGYIGLQGLLKFSKSKNWKVSNLMIKNSGDVSGDKSKVVGYASYRVE